MSARGNQKIKTLPFYREWKGHPIPDLTTFYSRTVAERPDKPIVWLAGDSSLDNKYWVPSSGPAGEPLPVQVPAIYTSTLDPPRPKPDVAFWLNHYLGNQATTINTAVEASMLRERDNGLLRHDKFIRDHIRAEDVLVVSIGGNDIALNPTFATIRHMLQLAWLTSHSSLERGTAWSLTYFKNMFNAQVKSYVSRIIEKQKPRAVAICMIYFPLEASASMQKSWADLPLKLLGYNRHPEQLQTAIKKMYELATAKIQIEGTTVVPCAFFDALDGKSKEDYTARVEPSVEGGRKMGEQLMDKLKSALQL
ncbi:hypothetical protein AOQ84DRAFT_354160 [Glonium stellatum]|uniref:Uncharacterized protein n=1 Tax=Glonium stellatum TaxID=574774 RepID=A0A8E2F216_9PEZI|nr:hypothetical protein AOQ84DRAFT_354160 [Glonium stellatum]